MSCPNPSDSARRRGEVLATEAFLEEHQVARQMGDLMGMRDLREAGLILGVWDPVTERVLYPAFQFEEGGRLSSKIADVLELVPEIGLTGWNQMEWFVSPHALLGGLRPMDVFGYDPDAVVAAAREEYASDPRGMW